MGDNLEQVPFINNANSLSEVRVEPSSNTASNPTSNIFTLLDELWDTDLNEEFSRQVQTNRSALSSRNSHRYYWTPLHYAAYYACPVKLQIICDYQSEENINSLSILSENALHILLQHNILNETAKLVCKNGPNLQTYQLINSEHEAITSCAKILLDAGVNYNHTNFWNETPLLIAIKRSYHKIVQLLLSQENIDLDSIRAPLCGKTARELLKPIQIPLVARAPNLFQFLKAGDEEGFVEYKVGQDWNCLDGANEANSCCTMLQYCFRRGYIFWLKSSELSESHPIELFCMKGMPRAILHLLALKADVNASLQLFEDKHTLLEAAIIRGYFPFVALILEEAARDWEFPRICEALKLLVAKQTGDKLNITLELVLSKIESLNLQAESTKLLAGVLSKKLSKENQLLLLKLPGSLSWLDSSKSLDPEILQTHFAEAFHSKNCQSFGDFFVPVLQLFLASSALSGFLKEPVFKILIQRHWEHLRFPKFGYRFFDVNLVFNILFYFLLNFFILVKFNNSHCWFLHIFGIAFLLVFTIKELLQVVADWRLYLDEKSNLFEVVHLIFASFVFFSQADWVDAFEVLAILSSNLVLLMLLVNVPAFTQYIIILRTLIFYFRYAIFYFTQFIAFALCFYILFARTDQIWYRDLSEKVFYTIILFTGNLDYMKTPWKQDDNSTWPMYHTFPYKQEFSQFIFIIFVIFLAIILQNLLLGFLVVDIGNVREKATLSQQIKKASFVLRLDTLLRSPNLRNLQRYFFNYERMKLGKELIVAEKDCETLTKDEKVALKFAKCFVREDPVKKLKNCILMKINKLKKFCEVKN